MLSTMCSKARALISMQTCSRAGCLRKANSEACKICLASSTAGRELVLGPEPKRLDELYGRIHIAHGDQLHGTEAAATLSSPLVKMLSLPVVRRELCNCRHERPRHLEHSLGWQAFSHPAGERRLNRGSCSTTSGYMQHVCKPSIRMGVTHSVGEIVCRNRHLQQSWAMLN